MPSVAFGHELGRDLSDRDHVVPPVVDAEQSAWARQGTCDRVARGHGGVSAQGRHDVDSRSPIILMGHAGQSGPAMLFDRVWSGGSANTSPRFQPPSVSSQDCTKVFERQIRRLANLGRSRCSCCCRQGGHSKLVQPSEYHVLGLLTTRFPQGRSVFRLFNPEPTATVKNHGEKPSLLAPG